MLHVVAETKPRMMIANDVGYGWAERNRLVRFATIRGVQTRPQLTHRVMNRSQQRAFNLNGIIETRLFWRRHVQVIDDVDTTDKCGAGINRDEFAMQSTQS